MPPHSECHYSSAIDSWSQVKGSLFCGHPAPPFEEPADAADDTKYPLPPPQFPGGTKRPNSPPRSTRNVLFAAEVEIFEIPNVRDYPKSQLAEMYMTKEEMAKIHAEAWEIVELMNLGIEYADGNSFSKRGLVDLKDDNVERRRRMREQAYKVVFGMQSMHNGVNADVIFAGKSSYSPQIMADLYTQVSSPSKNMAHRAALYDAMAATGKP